MWCACLAELILFCPADTNYHVLSSSIPFHADSEYSVYATFQLNPLIDIFACYVKLMFDFVCNNSSQGVGVHALHTHRTCPILVVKVRLYVWWRFLTFPDPPYPY
jgi:hypothetical protein